MSTYLTQTADLGLAADLTVEQKEQAIIARMQEVIGNASMDLLKQRLPQDVPVVEGIIETLDYSKPLSIASIGAWAMKDAAQAGLDMLTSLQQGPSAEALIAVSQFEDTLKARIAPLQKRLDKRSGRGPLRRFVSKHTQGIQRAYQAANEVVGRRFGYTVSSAQTRKLKTELEEMREDDAALRDIIDKTKSDTVAVAGQLAASRHVPALIDREINKIIGVYTETAEKLFITLVAVTEFQRKLEHSVLPDLEKTALSSASTLSDLESLELARKAIPLLEEARTGLASGIVNKWLQRGMAREMQHVNSSSAIELERLESGAIHHLCDQLGTMSLQQRVGELVTTTKTTNRITGAATAATTRGFAKVLELSEQADLAKLEAMTAVVSATDKTVTAVNKYRKHEQGQAERYKVARDKIAQAAGKLQRISLNLGDPAKAQAALPVQPSAAADGAGSDVTTPIAVRNIDSLYQTSRGKSADPS